MSLNENDNKIEWALNALDQYIIEPVKNTAGAFNNVLNHSAESIEDTFFNTIINDLASGLSDQTEYDRGTLVEEFSKLLHGEESKLLSKFRLHVECEVKKDKKRFERILKIWSFDAKGVASNRISRSIAYDDIPSNIRKDIDRSTQDSARYVLIKPDKKTESKE